MKRTRVDDRVAVAIAAAAGVAAAFSNVSPTGAQPFDAVVMAVSVGFVTWTAAAAPWWAPTTVAGVAAVFALDPVWIVIGAAACVFGLWLGTQRRDLSPVRGLVGGIGLNVLCWSDYTEVFGLTSVLGIGLGGLLVVTGVRRRARPVRRAVTIGAGALAAVVAVAAAGAGVAAVTARGDAAAGQRLFTEGIDLLRDGEYVEAAQAFTDSAASFGAAARKVDRPWALPGALVPVVAQNRRAVSEVAAASRTVSLELANTSLVVDSDALRVTGGRLDLDALDEVSGPVLAAYDALLALRETIDAVDSPYLMPTVERRLDSATVEFDDNIGRFDTAALALRVAPRMLGADRPHRYFIAFTTPAEARGLGGFMGNYAELTADDGQLSLTEFGRTLDLNSAAPAGARRVTGPADWLGRWGRYGFTNAAGGTAGAVPWSNVTVSPQFPSTADVIAQLYPQSGGAELDGVLAMDPYVLQALLGFTGPITVEGTEQRIDERNVVQFLLFDQYLIADSTGRVDLLAEVAETTLDELLDGALPGPTVLADRLGPLADAGRLVGWARNPDEQALFEALDMSGALPPLDGADGFGVVVNNAGANKLDVYLDRAVTYRAEFDPATRAVTGTIDVTFTNRAPTSGLPDGVIGNYVGDAIGTNRALVSFYTALPHVAAELDGEPIGLEPGLEAGWFTATGEVVIPAGRSVTISVTVAGALPVPADGAAASDAYELVVRTQPLVTAATYDIEVADPAGQPLVVAGDGVLDGVRRLRQAGP